MNQLLGYLMDALRWLVILVLATIYPESYSVWQGRVIAVVRPDEVKVVRLGDPLAQPVNVRLYGIDSPLTVRHQPFGKEAEAFAIRKLLGRVVEVQPLPGLVKGSWYRPKKFVPLDDLHWEGNVDRRYHRVIALVYVAGVNMSEEYLANGMAWWYKPFVPFEFGYEHLQDEARKARKGLWALPNPVPPWKWQKTPMAEVNPWQRKKWILSTLAVVGILITVLLATLLVVVARRFIRWLCPKARKRYASGPPT